MGLVVDTSVLIAAERGGLPVARLLRVLRRDSDEKILLAAVSLVELTHGIYRARTPEQGSERRRYVEEAVRYIDIAPLTLPIAQLAGRIDGEQAAVGNKVDLADLLIGATALHFDYAVATHNVRHFERIPGVRVVMTTI